MSAISRSVATSMRNEPQGYGALPYNSQEADDDIGAPFMQDVEADGSDSEDNTHDKQDIWQENIHHIRMFCISILLCIPSLVFLVTTLNLRATMHPPGSRKTIANLTQQLSELSHSFTTCIANSSTLATSLHQEEARVKTCMEIERRLATRLEVMDDMLNQCHINEADLKERLGESQEALNVCDNQVEELERQVERGMFVQFLDFVGKTGTGGDSWVCTDYTSSWSYGYTTTDSPHPTITIHTWTSDLDDAQHASVPLVFPPASDIAGSKQFQAYPRRGQLRMRQGDTSEEREAIPSDSIGVSPRILGYTVKSFNSSGNNGWWRINKPPAFGVEGGTLEFFASAGKWYGNSARFRVTVYWLSET